MKTSIQELSFDYPVINGAPLHQWKKAYEYTYTCMHISAYLVHENHQI